MNTPARLPHVPADAAPQQRIIPLESALAWKQALSGIPHSFFHSWEHCYAMYLTHKLPAFLYCFERGDTRVVCPFIERPFGEYTDIATPYGYAGFAGNSEVPDLPRYWKEFVRTRAYVSSFLTLHPLFFRSSYTTAKETHDLKSLYVLDTASHDTEFLSRCTKSRRQDIRKWQAGRVRLVTDRQQLTHFVLDHYREFFRRKNAGPSYDFSSATLRFILGLDNIVAIGAAQNDQIAAVHVTAFTAHAAEYLFYFGLRGSEGHSSGLIWEATRLLHDFGIRRFNLGGGLVDGDALDSFKRRFGGERYRLRVVKEVIRPEVYSELCRSVDANPQSRQGYFPCYRS